MVFREVAWPVQISQLVLSWVPVAFQMQVLVPHLLYFLAIEAQLTCAADLAPSLSFVGAQ
jgi:hypothetical protein